MVGTKVSLKQFASKRAATGAVVAGLVNALVVYLSLSGLAEVPIFALVAEHWTQSLIGALTPPRTAQEARLIGMLEFLIAEALARWVEGVAASRPAGREATGANPDRGAVCLGPVGGKQLVSAARGPSGHRSSSSGSWPQ